MQRRRPVHPAFGVRIPQANIVHIQALARGHTFIHARYLSEQLLADINMHRYKRRGAALEDSHALVRSLLARLVLLAALFHETVLDCVLQLGRVLMNSVDPPVSDQRAVNRDAECRIENGVGEVRDVLTGEALSSKVCLCCVQCAEYVD